MWRESPSLEDDIAPGNYKKKKKRKQNPKLEPTKTLKLRRPPIPKSIIGTRTSLYSPISSQRGDVKR